MSNSSPIWHPYTQHALFGEMVKISRAEGAYLFRENGEPILDAISSWWVNTHGHNHPKIIESVQQQAAKLDQVIFAGFTHAPAERLAEKLVKLTDASLTRLFYSDSGSTSVEVALKMAMGYWAHSGKPRHKIIALEHGYHGDTFGTMSVGGLSVYNQLYDPLLFEVQHLPFPEHDGQNTIKALQKIIANEGGQIAALIIEPLILGAGGMLTYSASILAQLHQLCRAHNILFIADEVMTAWGRTGTLFACEQSNVTPDILCLSKGLTGGFLPLAVTMCREEIYQAFYSADRAKTFYHSSSYTGNAIACAAACAALEIWDEEPVMQRIQQIAAYHQQAMGELARRDSVENLRQCGTIAAFDLVSPQQGYLSPIGPQLYNFFIGRGLLLRPLGNSIYIMPPYCVGKNELEQIYDGIFAALDHFGHGHQKSAV